MREKSEENQAMQTSPNASQPVESKGIHIEPIHWRNFFKPFENMDELETSLGQNAEQVVAGLASTLIGVGMLIASPLLGMEAIVPALTCLGYGLASIINGVGNTLISATRAVANAVDFLKPSQNTSDVHPSAAALSAPESTSPSSLSAPANTSDEPSSPKLKS